MRKGLLIFGLAIGFCVAGALNDDAQARPKYFSTFGKTYVNLKAKIKTLKCGVCHPKKDKKVNNDYGKAVGKAIGTKNAKKVDDILAGLKKVETVKGTGGKTYGEQIKAGDIPK